MPSHSTSLPLKSISAPLVNSILNNVKSYRLRQRLHDELIPDLLAARGIQEEREIEKFLVPDFVRDSGDPLQLPDMTVAVERVLEALNNAERIVVWSDYDCDGIPGGVMFTEFLRGIGGSVRHYIPHRHEEGYGLNREGVEELAKEGTKLIITIDLGTSDHESIALAKEKGIDVIVTDHHLPPSVLPEALAIINPKRTDSTYPFEHLCGAGVAWKLLQAILSRHRPEGFAEGKEKWFLDLVGLATLTDRVPLIGENRMLAHFGLKVMRRGRRAGLLALFSLLRIKPSALTEDDIGFMVAPRLNAASRMDSPEVASRLLATENSEEAVELARKLQTLNDERKGVVAATVREAKRRVLEGRALEEEIVVMGSPRWRPGILGLVANNLAEHSGMPVFLWGREGGVLLRGSCRSGNGQNIIELMREVADLFEDFGGHAYSGGFSLKEERVHELAPRLAAAYAKLKARAHAPQEIVLEREVDLAEAARAHRALAQLSPFGEGNPKPLLVFPHVTVSSLRSFGKAQDHLSLTLSRGNALVPGIAFFATPQSFSKPLRSGARVDAIGHLEQDWQGRPRIRLVDIL